ncbi:ABC transporter ATP-binding protein [Virgibacillus necropolis]|uniref:Nickel import system ATP-binding protein NikD n=1 Tax=Virgibacillus necropolis TaxID=163877 RepID=A0A221MH22_9BACI|nr:ABC transporter ATP-binding protein [Virgibacillus necropolis]ASN06947.1 peptide ABC transporter ATP-binding protein [Virgibacillus necropolis]
MNTSYATKDVDSRAVEDENPPLFEVENFSLAFRQFRGGFQETTVEVISKLDLTINEGEIVAVVGASGSGKSLLANAILGVLPENAILNGTLKYKGVNLTPKKQIRLRGKEISLIPQSVNALDPLMKAGKQVQTVIKRKQKKAIQRDIFQKMGLSTRAAKRYPFELSGGMARRVLASTAMVSGARLVIADEPTPGLDEHVLNETINHMKQLAVAGKGIMFITHDIGSALRVADKIVVFYAGQTVEVARVEDFKGKGENLRHPYTKALWNALPQNDFTPIEGSQPPVGNVTLGCVFEGRCSIASELCTKKQPNSRIVNGGIVRCFHA